jgi:hypothetical protein
MSPPVGIANATARFRNAEGDPLMAQIITVSRGDSVEKILKEKRNVKTNEILNWMILIREFNPHIGNLSRIWPGDKLMLPDTVFELVSEPKVWANAFSQIPSTLKGPNTGNTELYLTGIGETIDDIADKVFADGRHCNLSPNVKRALVLANNISLRRHLDGAHVPENMLVIFNQNMLNKFESHFWHGEQQTFLSHLNRFDSYTRDLYQEIGPQDAFLLAEMVNAVRQAGGTVGRDQVVDAGLGIAGCSTAFVSGYANSAGMSVSNINALLREIYAEAVEKYGAKTVVSKKANHLVQMNRFINGHPKYAVLMRQLSELPEQLLPASRQKMVPPTGTQINAAVARHFRKQYFQAYQNGSSSRYMGTIANQLSGKVQYFNSLGRHATWYVPAVLGFASVANAPSGVRMRVLFEEGFGVLGGYAGTLIGAKVIGVGIVAALGLGPLGAFIVVFLCAAAFGMAYNKIGKYVGGNLIYDYGEKLSAGQTYHSPDDILSEVLK